MAATLPAKVYVARRLHRFPLIRTPASDGGERVRLANQEAEGQGRAGSRSTLIVPGKARNRGHRDPLKEREYLLVRPRMGKRGGNAEFHFQVNVTAADSRACGGLHGRCLGHVALGCLRTWQGRSQVR